MKLCQQLSPFCGECGVDGGIFIGAQPIGLAQAMGRKCARRQRKHSACEVPAKKLQLIESLAGRAQRAQCWLLCGGGIEQNGKALPDRAAIGLQISGAIGRCGKPLIVECEQRCAKPRLGWLDQRGKLIGAAMREQGVQNWVVRLLAGQRIVEGATPPVEFVIMAPPTANEVFRG